MEKDPSSCYRDSQTYLSRMYSKAGPGFFSGNLKIFNQRSLNDGCFNVLKTGFVIDPTESPGQPGFIYAHVPKSISAVQTLLCCEIKQITCLIL